MFVTPVGNGAGDELGSVVKANEGRVLTAFGRDASEGGDHAVSAAVLQEVFDAREAISDAGSQEEVDRINSEILDKWNAVLEQVDDQCFSSPLLSSFIFSVWMAGHTILPNTGSVPVQGADDPNEVLVYRAVRCTLLVFLIVTLFNAL